MNQEEEEEDKKHHQKCSDKVETTILESRRIFLSDAVDNESAQEVIAKLWYLDAKEPGKPIILVINCPGGQVDSGFAIWDQIKMIQSPVATIISGLAASFGSVLSLAANPKWRFATPYARIMLHSPLLSGVLQGQATDLEIQAKEILKTKEILIDIYVKATGKPREAIERAIDRNTWMTAKEAVEFGLLDKVISSYDELSKLIKK